MLIVLIFLVSLNFVLLMLLMFKDGKLKRYEILEDSVSKAMDLVLYSRDMSLLVKPKGGSALLHKDANLEIGFIDYKTVLLDENLEVVEGCDGSSLSPFDAMAETVSKVYEKYRSDGEI